MTKQERLTAVKILQLQDLTEPVLKQESCFCIGFYFNVFGNSEKTYIFECNNIKYKSILQNYEFNESEIDQLYLKKKNETQIFV